MEELPFPCRKSRDTSVGRALDPGSRHCFDAFETSKLNRGIVTIYGALSCMHRKKKERATVR